MVSFGVHDLRDQEPDLRPGDAVDRRPAYESVRRLESRRNPVVDPAHSEAVRVAPCADGAVRGDRTNARVEGIACPRNPWQCNRHGGDGRRHRAVVPYDPAPYEQWACRQHELVPRGSARRIPGKRRGARERRRPVWIARKESVQAARRRELRGRVVCGRVDGGLRSTGEGEHGQTEGSNTNERHTSWVFGSYAPAGVPRRRDAASSLAAARTSASSPG